MHFAAGLITVEAGVEGELFMNRRDLLAGAATLAGSRLLAQAVRGKTEHSGSSSESGPIGRETPTNPLVLRNSEVEVTFDSKHGLPYSYRYRERRLWGEIEGKPIEAILCRLEPRTYQTVTLESSRVYRTPNSVQFDFQVTWEGRPAANLRLRYVLERRPWYSQWKESRNSLALP